MCEVSKSAKMCSGVDSGIYWEWMHLEEKLQRGQSGYTVHTFAYFDNLCAQQYKGKATIYAFMQSAKGCSKVEEWNKGEWVRVHPEFERKGHKRVLLCTYTRALKPCTIHYLGFMQLCTSFLRPRTCAAMSEKVGRCMMVAFPCHPPASNTDFHTPHIFTLGPW